MATTTDLAQRMLQFLVQVQFFMNDSLYGCGLSSLPTLMLLGWTEEYVQALGNYNDPYVPGRVT